VEGIIPTVYPHEQTHPDYEHKEVCLTAHSIFIVYKKVLHPNRLI
jgi:hypothetical protein